MAKLRIDIPSPFSIGLLLTIITFILAVLFTQRPENSGTTHFLNIFDYWQTGFWELFNFHYANDLDPHFRTFFGFDFPFQYNHIKTYKVL